MTDFEKILDMFDRAKVKYGVDQTMDRDGGNKTLLMKFGFNVLCFDFVSGELITTYNI